MHDNPNKCPPIDIEGTFVFVFKVYHILMVAWRSIHKIPRLTTTSNIFLVKMKDVGPF
jgi:hypothetical protein